jgi:hypothetical protein
MFAPETRESQRTVLGLAVVIELIGAILVIGGLLSLWPSPLSQSKGDIGSTTRMIR